jgi:hypothetical protein
MQEKHKTLAFILVALMAVLVAWEPWRPAPAANNAPADVGTKLFPAFTDPNAAKSLNIITYDEDNATISDFRVAQVNDVWSIPSHSNYPADAREHMAQAATALLDIEILGVDSTKPGDRELYGVITPEPEKLTPGAVGVGRRVTIKDDKDKVLADLVIGKEVKDQPQLRYVRRADRDQIYRVNVKTDKFTTKFEDWIEKNLLKLNAFDVRGVELNDYSLTENATREGVVLRMKKNSLTKLAFDDAKSNWSLVEMATFDKEGKPVVAELAADEELNSEKLNALKTALNDLLIVDVQRKPKGLSQDLRASDEFVKDKEAQMSLIERGFYPVGENNEIFSSEGEATCTTKDGVRYILRFGRLAGGPLTKDDKNPGEKEKSNPALNRYLFVMAQLDESQIPKPQLEPVPGEEKPAAESSEEKPAEEKADAKGADDKPADEKPADDKASAKKAPETKTAAADDQPPAKQKKSAGKAKKGSAKTKQTAAEEAEAPPADETKAEEPKADEAKAAEPKAEAEPAEAAKAEGVPAEAKDGKPGPSAEEKKIAIQKENKRKQDEYDAALKKAQDKVKELNDRFADWYFIISDDVYKKIHLGRNDIVKKKEAEGAEKKPGQSGGVPGIGDLQELQKGLQGK